MKKAKMYGEFEGTPEKIVLWFGLVSCNDFCKKTANLTEVLCVVKFFPPMNKYHHNTKKYFNLTLPRFSFGCCFCVATDGDIQGENTEGQQSDLLKFSSWTF